MKSIIKNFFYKKKISSEENIDNNKNDNNKLFTVRKIEVKPKEGNKVHLNQMFLTIYEDIEDSEKDEDIFFYKKNIKYNCKNGNYENLLLYNLDYIDIPFLKQLIVMMNITLNNIQLYKHPREKIIIEKIEGLYKCIDYIQDYIDTMSSINNRKTHKK